MPQPFSGGFDEKSNPLPRMFAQINKDSDQYERDNKYRDAVYMLDRLRTVGCKTKVHYLPSGNPFHEHYQFYDETDIDAAIQGCISKIPLRADYGSAVEDAIKDLVPKCYLAGYAVDSPEVRSAMYSAAVHLASVSYQTQLGQHQANYGTYDSSKTKTIMD